MGLEAGLQPRVQNLSRRTHRQLFNAAAPGGNGKACVRLRTFVFIDSSFYGLTFCHLTQHFRFYRSIYKWCKHRSDSKYFKIFHGNKYLLNYHKPLHYPRVPSFCPNNPNQIAYFKKGMEGRCGSAVKHLSGKHEALGSSSGTGQKPWVIRRILPHGRCNFPPQEKWSLAGTVAQCHSALA